MANEKNAKREPTEDELTLRYRDFAISIEQEALDAARAAANGNEPATIPVALSSEFGVERYDFWEDERYTEILDHSPSAVDLSRAQNGLPFLDSHDMRRQLGIIENVRLGADKRLRGDVRFSRRAEAQDLKRDMLDGIRKDISVGYRIDRSNLEKTTKDGQTTLRVKRWTPFEGSSVSIPADPTVGVGRSAREDAPRSPAILTSARRGQEHTVENEKTAAADASGAVTNEKSRAQWITEGTEAEKKRADQITEIAAAHSIDFPKVREWIGGSKSVADIAMEALGIVKERGAKKQTVGEGKPAVELTEREQKQYSMQRAISLLVDEIDNPRRAASANSFEREISQELEKNFPAGAGIKRRGGLLIPTFTRTETVREMQYGLPYGSLSQRAGLDSATSTKGAELKFTVPGEFLPILRNFMALMRAGTTLMGGLQGPVAFPNQNGAGTASWVTENPGSDVADSNLTLQQITLAPKSLQSSTSYSRQLLAQSVIDIDGVVRMDLAAITALALDLGGINGSGSSGQPTGILNTSGVGLLALGTNGATPTYANLVDLETLVTAANADQWPLAHLVHPTTRGTFKKATPLSNTVGQPVWTAPGTQNIGDASIQGQPGSRVQGELNNYPAWASAQVPNNLTKGTSSGICLAIILGAFSQAVIGDWGMFEIIVDPYRLKKQGMIELTSFAMYGFAVKYAAGFAKIIDALA